LENAFVVIELMMFAAIFLKTVYWIFNLVKKYFWMRQQYEQMKQELLMIMEYYGKERQKERGEETEEDTETEKKGG